MEQDGQYLKKRLLELSRRAFEKNIVTFSNFLNLNEIHICCQSVREFYSSFQLSGGYSCAERQMAAFVPDALSYAWEYPINAVLFTPAHPKFAEDVSHRDVLGALMNLGIRREMLGDILMTESGIIVLCAESMADYLTDSCTKIRHTSVNGQKIPLSDFQYQPEFQEKESIVSSLRLDSILADVCKLTRSAAQKLISEGNAFINSRKIQQNDYACREGDILSVRHFGKFQIAETGGVTKKGRIKYRYKIYT